MRVRATASTTWGQRRLPGCGLPLSVRQERNGAVASDLAEARVQRMDAAAGAHAARRRPLQLQLLLAAAAGKRRRTDRVE